MKKAVFISILLNLICYSAYSQEQDSLMTENGYWANGSKKYHFIFPDGVHEYNFTYWHPDGSLHMKGRYFDNDIYIHESWSRLGKALAIDGNGYHIDYYENGQIRQEGFVKDKMKDSLWMEYYPNGQMKSKGQFLNSWDASEEGVWFYWYENGQTESTGLYKNGVKRGVWTYYHRNGEKSAEISDSEFMNRGKYLRTWDKNGNQSYGNGEGYYYEYFPGGELKIKIHIADSLKDTAYSFFSNGQANEIYRYLTDSNRTSWWHEYHYIDGWDSLGNKLASHGTGWKYEYNEEGKLFKKTYFSNGVQDSISIEYYPGGVIREINRYEEGVWVYRTIYFNNGKKYYEFDVYNIPVITNSHSTEWWYNGNLKREELADSLVEYHPNGQKKAVGYYPLDDTTVTEQEILNRNYYLTEEWESEDDPEGWTWSKYFFARNQWNKTWYADGTLKSVVAFDSVENRLIMKYYNSQGGLISTGAIRYGNWKYNQGTHKDPSHRTEFQGYVKVGKWQYYNSAEVQTDEKDFDSESVDKRKID